MKDFVERAKIFRKNIENLKNEKIWQNKGFQVSISADLGIIEQITINVYDSDEIVYSDEAEILLGEPTMLIFEDFESL